MSDTSITIQVKALYVNGIDRYPCPDFTNIVGAEMENECIALLCGAGFVRNGNAGLGAGLLLEGSRVAFCGFGAPAFCDELTVPVSCVVPLRDGLSFAQAATTGMLVPLAEAAARAGVTLGEHVLIVCRDETAETAALFFERIGCVPHVLPAGNGNCESFAFDLMEKTNGHGVDAAVLLGVDVPVELPLTELCKNAFRIVCAVGTGAGYDDREYMQGKARYPHGYTRQTMQDHLEYALSLVSDGFVPLCPTVRAENLHAVDAEMIYLAADAEETAAEQRLEAPELPEESKHTLDELRSYCARRLEPCLLQLTARYADIPAQAKESLPAQAAYILGAQIARTDVQASEGIWTLSAVMTDGSIAVVHALSGFAQEMLRCEVHFDGHTAVLENGALRTY